MIISKVEINNYKSIKNMSLEFVEGKNIIVGQNNSGKSNIISAINLLMGEKYPPKRFEDNYYFNNSNQFSICVELSKCIEFDDSYLKKYTKNIGIYKLNRNRSYLLNSPDELDEQGLISSWKKSGELIETIKQSKHIYIALLSRKGEDTIYTLNIDDGEYFYKLKFFSNEWIYSFITSAIIPSERNLKNELIVNNYSWYGKLIKAVWTNMSEEDMSLLSENNKHLTDVTNSIFQGLTDELGESVRDAIPYNKLEFKLIQDTKTDYYKGIKILLDDGYYSLLEDKGSGIKSLIIIELFKLYCKKYHAFSSCLIVEEPEVFLHPQARRVLSKKIDQFLEGNSNQTIITTHSEQFISNFDIKQLTFVNKENGESKKYKIVESDFSKKDFQKINIITKTENAEMYFADTVILVEGGEKYIIKTLFEIYKDELFLDYNNISVVSVGGKSYFSIYKKMLEKLGKKVYIIGDYDNLKGEINEFLDKIHLQMLNHIKSKNNGLLKYQELPNEDKEELDKVLAELINKNVFILRNGALEDYYNKEKTDKLFQENGISGKEVQAHYLSTIINRDNVNDILDVENDFKDYIQTIIKDINI